MTRSISYEVILDCSYEAALDRVTASLKEEGFGVLTRIDIHDALKEKIGVEFRPYTILGACNPPLAYKALSAVPEAGLMLPCNVTVEAGERGGAVVRIVNPNEMMRMGGFEDDERVAAVGREANDRLQRVAEALRSA